MATITTNDIEFPTTPTIQSYLDVPTNPSVALRWIRFQEMDLLWRGKCVHCGRAVWQDADDKPLEGLLMGRYIMREVTDEDGTVYGACQTCAQGYDIDTIAADGRGYDREDRAPVIWPDEIMAQFQQRREAEQRKQQRWIERVPMVPSPMSLVYLRDERLVTYFEGWGPDGKAMIRDHEPVEQEKVFALIPAIYGVSHNNLINIPSGVLNCTRGGANLSSQERPVEGTATGWTHRSSTGYVNLKDADGTGYRFSVDAVACFVPSVNPATERQRDALRRLQYKADRMEFAMHARLVAEGASRDWCSVFDPILAAQGLAQRGGGRVISGTVSFSYRTDTESISEESLSEIRQGRNVYDYLPSSAFTDWKVEVTEVESARLLS